MSEIYNHMSHRADVWFEDTVGWLMDKSDEGKWWHPLTLPYHIMLFYDSMFCRAAYHFGGVDEYLEWINYGLKGRELELYYK